MSAALLPGTPRADIVADIVAMILGGDQPDVADVGRLCARHREQLVDWAGALHFAASDNRVRVPAVPTTALALIRCEPHGAGARLVPWLRREVEEHVASWAWEHMSTELRWSLVYASVVLPDGRLAIGANVTRASWRKLLEIGLLEGRCFTPTTIYAHARRSGPRHPRAAGRPSWAVRS